MLIVLYAVVAFLLTTLSPEERQQRARLAALTRWSREDPTATAIRAQAGLTAKFEREIRGEFPGLDDTEVARRVECARRAHFSRLAFLSAKARRRRSGSGDAA